jgi:hypothetical protein
MEPSGSHERVRTSLENLMSEEFVVKKYSVYVFTISSLSYLIMSIVRGKGSLPYYVQIPTCFLYCLLSVLAKVYGDKLEHQH